MRDFSKRFHCQSKTNKSKKTSIENEINDELENLPCDNAIEWNKKLKYYRLNNQEKKALKLFEIGSFVYVHFDYGTLIGKLVSCDIIRKDQEDTKVTFAVEFDHGRVCTDIPEERVERWIPPVNKMRDAIRIFILRIY